MDTIEDKVVRLATIAAHIFKLNKFSTIHVVGEIDDGCYGWCDDQGEIEIRVTQLRSKKFLSDRTIIDTLAHELAHLDEWDHGASHRRLTIAICVWLERNWNE